MEKDIHGYIANRLKTMTDQLRIAKKQLSVDEDMLEFEEERNAERIKQLKEQLHNDGWSDEDIKSEVLAQYDAFEDWLDDLREEITQTRERIFQLENDIIIFENYGR